MFKILRNAAVLAYVRPDDNSELEQTLMIKDVVKLNFTHSTFLDLQIGDYIEWQGVNYELKDIPNVDSAPNQHKYTCNFVGGIHLLNNATLMLDKNFTFSLTGSAEDFLNFCVSNLNRDIGGYTAGTFEETEPITLDFDNMKLYDAIVYIVEKLGIEFYLVGKILHFTKNETDSGLSFSVGRFEGLYNLNRKKVESSNIITKLWVYGSTDNLRPDYVSPLLTKRLHFENVDLNNESRLEQNIELYGVREEVKKFDEIRPERTGTVTAIDAGNNRVFIDATMDFDLNDNLLPGLTPKVNFKTGALAGITFDLSYSHATKTFTIDYFEDESGTYPNDILKFAVGDNCVLFDIFLPQAYDDDAKTRLRTAGQEYLNTNCIPNNLYELDVDKSHVLRNNIVFKIGNYLTIVDANYGINGLMRVIGLKQKITSPEEYDITVGELLPTGLLDNFKKSINNQNTVINTVVNSTYSKTETINQISIQGGVKWE